MQNDLSGLNMTDESDYAMWQAEDEKENLAKLMACLEHLEAVISTIEEQFSVELTETRESLKTIRLFCGVG